MGNKGSLVVFDFESYSESSEFSPQLDICAGFSAHRHLYLCQMYNFGGIWRILAPMSFGTDVRLSVPFANNHSWDHIATGGNIVHPGVPTFDTDSAPLLKWAEAIEANTNQKIIKQHCRMKCVEL
jgi:hypothetical protein